ncbi:MAG: site-specific integrase [Erysipelotrichaceae bacterium]|nr:site-specific integrase [Erysipelotrichaceae bacterium]
MPKKEKYIKVKHYKSSTYYTVQFSYEHLGEKHTYSKTFSTMKEAVQHRDIKRAELITNGLPSGSRKLKELLEDYIRIDRMKISTATRHRCAFAHVPELHEIDIKKLTPLDIQRSLNSLIYDCSDGDIRTIYMVLKRICDTAILEGFLTVSPMGRVILPKSEKIVKERPKTVSSDADIEKIFEALENPSSKHESVFYNYKVLKHFLEVMMYTGMRPSEVLALKRKNIHLDTGYIDVESRIGSNETTYGVETRLKTDSSRRRIPMSSACSEVFKSLIEMSDNDYLFTMYNGKLLYDRYISTVLRTICKKLGIEFHPYMLRHRAATKIIVEGKADPRTAMEILGHSNISTTLNIYSHSNDEEKLHVISLVENGRKPS